KMSHRAGPAGRLGWPSLRRGLRSSPASVSGMTSVPGDRSDTASDMISTLQTQELTVSNFPGVDYMEIDSLFSEEELMVRQTVRDFVDEEVLPIIEHAHREEKFPNHLVPKMAEMGLFGATISEYGLPGLNQVAYRLIMQELER